jgi:sterol desaturase/sphingolipid hydroxylase (fatty acid hydroxylase superfamily)
MDNLFDLVYAAITTLFEKGYFDVRNIYRQFYQESLSGIFFWQNILKYILVSLLLAVLYRFIFKSPKINPKFIFTLAVPKSVLKYRTFKFDLYFLILSLIKVHALFLKVLSLLTGIYFLPRLLNKVEFYNNSLIMGLHELVLDIHPDLRKPVIFLIAFVAYDFFLYCGHYFLHTRKSLWCFHQVHHYPQQMSLISTLRAHPVDAIFMGYIPGILLSLVLSLLMPFDISLSTSPNLIADSGALVLIFVVIPGTLNFFSHSRLPISYGKMEYVFLSPNSHLVHHSRDISGKNLGATLSIWDRLFGTFHQLKSVDEYLKVVENVGSDDANDELYSSFGEVLVKPFVTSFRILFPRSVARR